MIFLLVKGMYISATGNVKYEASHFLGLVYFGSVLPRHMMILQGTCKFQEGLWQVTLWIPFLGLQQLESKAP